MRAPRDHDAGAGQRGRTSACWRGAVVVAAAALSLAVGAVPASAAGGYAVTATIPVGSNPSGVAVDPVTHTVYVINYYGGTVSVIDAATRAVTATVPVGSNPDAVAVDPAARTVYVTHSLYGGTVSVIDAATRAVTATIPVGSQPYGVAVDPTAHTVYVANYSDGTVSVIDAATRAVTATIPVGSQPYGVAVDPAAGTVYVTNDGDGTVSVIDAATRAVTATIPVGSEPDGVAVDPATHTAYVTNEGDGTVSVISAPLAAPSGLAAKLAGPVSGPPSGVALTWTDNATDPAATRVRVQRASDPGFTTGLADFPLGAAATSYTDTAVTEGATYYYRVRAENEASNSAWSSTVSVVYTTVPAAPAGLTATLAGSSVSLTWTAPAGTAPATRLRIQRATDPGFTSGVTGILAGPAATSYTDNGVTQGTTYYYRVRAENKASNSAWSNTASILVPRPVPAAPANLTARAYPSGFGQASIDLTWTENPALAVTGFTIQTATNSAFTTGVTTSTARPATRKYTLTGLRRRTRYYVRIQSVNGPAASGWTTAMVTTP